MEPIAPIRQIQLPGGLCFWRVGLRINYSTCLCQTVSVMLMLRTLGVLRRHVLPIELRSLRPGKSRSSRKCSGDLCFNNKMLSRVCSASPTTTYSATSRFLTERCHMRSASSISSASEGKPLGERNMERRGLLVVSVRCLLPQ